MTMLKIAFAASAVLLSEVNASYGSHMPGANPIHSDESSSPAGSTSGFSATSSLWSKKFSDIVDSVQFEPVEEIKEKRPTEQLNSVQSKPNDSTNETDVESWYSYNEVKDAMFQLWSNTMQRTGATIGKFVVMGIKHGEHFSEIVKCDEDLLKEREAKEALKVEVALQEKETQQIKSELAELKEKEKAAQSSLDSKKLANEKLRQKISLEQQKLARARKEIDQKQELIDQQGIDRDTDFEKYQNEIKNLLSEHQKVIQDMANQNADTLRAQEEATGELEKELSTLKDKLSETEQRLTGVSADLRTTQGELEKKEQEISQGERKRTELQQKMADMTTTFYEKLKTYQTQITHEATNAIKTAKSKGFGGAWRKFKSNVGFGQNQNEKCRREIEALLHRNVPKVNVDFK